MSKLTIKNLLAEFQENHNSSIWKQFALWLLVDPEFGVIQFTKPDSAPYNAIMHIEKLFIDNCNDLNAWRIASKAAVDAGANACGWGAPWQRDPTVDMAAGKAAYAAHYAACVPTYGTYINKRIRHPINSREYNDDMQVYLRVAYDVSEIYFIALYAAQAYAAANINTEDSIYQIIADKLIELLKQA